MVCGLQAVDKTVAAFFHAIASKLKQPRKKPYKHVHLSGEKKTRKNPTNLYGVAAKKPRKSVGKA